VGHGVVLDDTDTGLYRFILCIFRSDYLSVIILDAPRNALYSELGNQGNDRASIRKKAVYQEQCSGH